MSLLDRLARSRVVGDAMAAEANERASMAGAGMSTGEASERASLPGAVASTSRESGGFARVRTRFDFPAGGARSGLLGGALAHVAVPGARALDGCLEALCGHCAGSQAAAAGHRGAAAGSGATARPAALFLDLETTGLGGAGAVPFVVGLAFAAAGEGAQADGYVVEQWCLEKLSAEASMLADLAARVAELAPRHLVSFNGASFDVPLLRRRFAACGVADVLHQLLEVHVDLLCGARRLWRDRVSDCRLATLEREKLGMRRLGDMAGQDIPEVFWSWLRAPDSASSQARMAAVRVHNQVDLVALPALALRLTAALRDPGDLGERLRGARHLQTIGDEPRALELLAPALAELDELGTSDPRHELARAAGVLGAQLLARAHRHDDARRVWHILRRSYPGDPVIHEALAKDLEHRQRDPERALLIAASSDLPCARRVERLRRKVGLLDSAGPGRLP